MIVYLPFLFAVLAGAPAAAQEPVPPHETFTIQHAATVKPTPATTPAKAPETSTEGELTMSDIKAIMESTAGFSEADTYLVDPARMERFKHAEALGHAEGAVVGKQHAHGADAHRARFRAQPRQQVA